MCDHNHLTTIFQWSKSINKFFLMDFHQIEKYSLEIFSNNYHPSKNIFWQHVGGLQPVYHNTCEWVLGGSGPTKSSSGEFSIDFGHQKSSWRKFSVAIVRWKIPDEIFWQPQLLKNTPRIFSVDYNHQKFSLGTFSMAEVRQKLS